MSLPSISLLGTTSECALYSGHVVMAADGQYPGPLADRDEDPGQANWKRSGAAPALLQ